jgi:hypothetical protein
MTQVLFKGASWQTSPEIAQRMFRLYPKFRALHELMWQLDFAISRVAASSAAPLQRRLYDIEALCEGSADLVERMDVMSLRREVRSRLRGLAAARQTPASSTGSAR